MGVQPDEQESEGQADHDVHHGVPSGVYEGGPIPHDPRRTAVRNLERAGVPRSQAMKLTGHTTESVYRRCAIVSDADLRVAVDRLDARLSRSSSMTLPEPVRNFVCGA
jgi:hypothetical protein